MGSKSRSGIIGRKAYPESPCGSALAGLPGFLDRPATGPFSGREWIARTLGVAGRRVFHEILDLEARGSQQADHLTVRDRELHRSPVVGPVEPVHAEVGAYQRFARREILVGKREHREVGMPEEYQ